VREKRKGPIGRAAGLAEGVAATVRRMQREREPRVLVYDETGYARLVQLDGRGYERLLETAERMVELVEESDAEAKPRRPRRAADAPARPRRAKPPGDGA
jgi:hypothetical protein